MSDLMRIRFKAYYALGMIKVEGYVRVQYG